MAETTPITPQIPKEAEEMPLTSTDMDLNNAVETATSSTSMSIEIISDSNENLSTSSSQASTDTPTGTNPSKDDLDSSPMALQSLVLAAASDLMEVSPRSSSDMDTPTSQAGTPYADRNLVENAKNAATSTTPEQPEPANNKPKGILRKKPRYTSSVPIILDGTSDLSPTTGNTIHNMNQYRKNRGNSDFDFDFLDIDRLVDKDDENFYNSENGGSTTLLSILWSLVVMPVVLLGYGGLPYIVLASMIWTLIFVARWIRRFLVEEFSMRRNHGGLNEEDQKVPMPTALDSPFPAKKSSISELNGHTNLSGILSVISPVAGARKTKVRFPEGIKFPERKLLRQPVPRIQKPNKQKTNTRNSTKKPFFGDDEHCEGDTWSLDSLMVLRNYMKDSDYNHGNNHNGLDPTPLSVMTPPPPYPPTLSDDEKIPPPSENEPASGDEADDEYTDSASSMEDYHFDDEVPELMTALARRRDSLMLFPQDGVQPAIQLDNCMDDEPIDDYFQEGLFGKSDSSSPTAISDSKLRKKASRYRRRKPRDSLCFTFGKKSVVPECPSIPQCPSDELEFLEQKKQEKFDQAVVIEHFQQSPYSITVEDTKDASPWTEETNNGYEIEDRDDPSNKDLLEEILAEDSDVTTSSLTSGSWDENEETSEHQELSVINESDDDVIYEDVDENSFESDVSVEEEIPVAVTESDLDEKVQSVLKDVEDLLKSRSEIRKSPSHHLGQLSDKKVIEPSMHFVEAGTGDETPLMTKSLPGFNNHEIVKDDDNDSSPLGGSQSVIVTELAVNEGNNSNTIDEAMQQHDLEEISIVDEVASSTDDDFPNFNVMQEISFDESDEVECILSHNAFQFDDDETMFRDRDPMTNATTAEYNKFAFEERGFNQRNGPMVREVLESSSDLQLDISATDDDIECKLSQIQTAETEMSTFDENDDIDAEHLASSPLKSPENKENFVRKIPLGSVEAENLCVDTTSAPIKTLDQSRSPWSPALPRAALSPTY